MGKKHNDFIDCIGTITVLTVDRVIFQGQLKKDHDEERKHDDCQPNIEVKVENENEFITLELACDVEIIRDNADIEETDPPLFEEGDLVRINVANIVAVGPSNGCFDEEKGNSENSNQNNNE